MCLGWSMYFSMKTVSSPNADFATALVEWTALTSSSALFAIFIPIPPPPADAFTMTGYPISSASSMTDSGSSIPAEIPGMIGTPAFAIIFLAVILLPTVSMDLPDGPMKTTPIFSHSLANSGFSARKPYPGCIASAPVFSATSRILSIRR